MPVFPINGDICMHDACISTYDPFDILSGARALCVLSHRVAAIEIDREGSTRL